MFKAKYTMAETKSTITSSKARACLKQVNMPKRRLFFHHALPIFLELHPVFLRQIGFVWRNNFSPSDTVPLFKQRLEKRATVMQHFPLSGAGETPGQLDRRPAFYKNCPKRFASGDFLWVLYQLERLRSFPRSIGTTI